MAATRSPLSLIQLVTLTVLILFASTEHSGAQSLTLAPSAMVLLLRHIPLQRRDASERVVKRRLRKDNARMRLYDDLLTDGYYTTRLWIGTPPQEFALIVDTGSTVTYVPCSDCEQCGMHQDPRFQPHDSSTYEPEKCNLNCNCDADGKYCIYETQYAEMSSSSGVLGNDMISFGNESQLLPQRLVFGCENAETGSLYSQQADGIVGLGRGQPSIVDQLVEKSAISNSFSLCYGGMDTTGGAMVLGKILPPHDMVFVRSDPNHSPYYNIDLTEMHVAGKPLNITSGIFDRKYGTVLDSGTTYAYLPKAAFVAFKDAIMKEIPNLKRIDGPDSTFDDICFTGAGSVSELSKTFPEVSMVFGNGQNLLLSPENYLFQHSKVRGAYCLGFFENGNDPTTLLGGIVVRNTLVTYDQENEKIGFWKTNCADLWKGLNSTSAASGPGPPATPSSSPASAQAPAVFSTNKDANLAPTPATSGSSGVISFITFEMLFSMNISRLNPSITELSEAIAQDLDVNLSQVHLLYFTSKGNNYIAQWALYPSAQDTYFPTTAATMIILRLTTYQLHLPYSFMKYQIVDWKIQPHAKRNWCGRHMLALLVGGHVDFALGVLHNPVARTFIFIPISSSWHTLILLATYTTVLQAPFLITSALGVQNSYRKEKQLI